MQSEKIQIPFNIPYMTQQILHDTCSYVQKNPFESKALVNETEQNMRLYLKLNRVKKMYFVHSATHALEMMALALAFRPGDEVIVPAYTYVATANAFAKSGATVRFADIDPLTFNISVTTVRPLINQHTRAIVPIHYAGYPADLYGLKHLCEAYDIVLLEDAAHAIGVNLETEDDEIALGTFGEMGCISFHATKNITSGGTGGVLFVNEDHWISKLDEIYHEGTNRVAFLSSEVNAYTWVTMGGFFQMSVYNMAFLNESLPHISSVNQRRKEICKRYRQALNEVELSCFGVSLPHVESPNGHIFYMHFSDSCLRERFIISLREFDIFAHKHYEPLHLSEAGVKYGYFEKDLPVTEEVARGLVRLPVYYSMTIEDQDEVIEHIKLFFKGKL